MRDWMQYRENLRNFIENPESGMLLDSSGYPSKSEKTFDSADRAFQLTSGAVRRHFITIWELFQHSQELKECMEHLADKALEVRRKVNYSMIVTSTSTAKELTKYIQPRVESDEPVLISHFGHYPTLTDTDQRIPDLTGQRVLILTDVVASGTLTKRLGEIVSKNGGTPVAVLAVVVTGKQFIDYDPSSNSPPTICIGSRSVRIHRLTDYLIEDLCRNQYQKSKLHSIDPITVLPTANVEYPHDIDPMFDFRTSLAHFEQAEALDFGFFQVGHKRYSLAVRFDRLLKERGKRIWKKIWPFINAESVLVTDVGKEDLLFKSFVEENLEKSGNRVRSVIVLKQDPRDNPYQYDTLLSRSEELQSQHITLLLASATSSNKMKNIVARLISIPVESICVICLLNRMGVYTTTFVRRIQRLALGIGRGQMFDNCAGDILKKSTLETDSFQSEKAYAAFSFYPVYSLLDVKRANLSKMHQTVNSIIDSYRDWTHVPNFRMQIDQLMTHFTPQSLCTIEFANGVNLPLDGPPYTLSLRNDLEVEARTIEGKVCLITQRLVTDGDFLPLIEELKTTTDYKLLFHIFGLLIIDQEFLHLQGRFEIVQNIIMGRLASLRKSRFELERNRHKEYDEDELDMFELDLLEILDTEFNLLTGLGLIAHLYHPEGFNEGFWREILACGRTSAEWLNYPSNLMFFLTEERLPWVISLFLHALHPRIREDESLTQLRYIIKSAAEEIIGGFNRENLKTVFDDDDASHLSAKIKDTSDLLLTELGVHDRKEKHETIRFLHGMVLSRKDRHHPILRDLSTTLQSLEGIFLREDRISSPYARRRINESLDRELTAGLHASTLLVEVSEAIQYFFMTTPMIAQNSRRYINGPKEPGFAQDVANLGRFFKHATQIKTLSYSEFKAIEKIIANIRRDFYESTSDLRMNLLRYVVPLDEFLIDEIERANNTLKLEGFGPVWDGWPEKISRYVKDIDEDWHVLIDRFTLRDVLNNMLTNVRHSLMKPGSILDPVSISLAKIESLHLLDENKISGESKSTKSVELCVTARGKPYRPSRSFLSCTIADQESKIAELGGELKLTELPEQNGSLARLILISRSDLIDAITWHCKGDKL